jgi:Trk K+ transport system NAD-binding subunit
MRPVRARRRDLASRLWYRLDRFLGMSPAVQILAVAVLAFVLALLFGGAIYELDGTGEVASVGDGLWWAVTRMLDGGNVASDSGLARRGFGVGVTLFGLLAVAVLTGAFASTFTERMRAVHKGTIPIFERHHALLLGWNELGGVLVRELARSGLARTLVVLTDQDRAGVEERVAEQLQVPDKKCRLRVIVRRGDPTTVEPVRRAAARHADVVVIMPEAASGAGVDRAALRSLLAARRALGGRRVPILVEVAGDDGREIVELAAGDDEVIVVEARDVGARVVGHALEKPGALDVVRQILSLDSRSIYALDARPLAGKTFDEAHAALEGGVLIGLLQRGAPALAPRGDERLLEGDRLLVFSDDGEPKPAGGSLPAPPERPKCAPERVARPPLDVLAIGYKPELATILAHAAHGREVRCTLLAEPESAVRAERAMTTSGGIELEIVACDSLDPEALERALRRPRDIALLLAPDVPVADVSEADSDQLVALLHLRRLDRDLRVLAEIRAVDTKQLATGWAAGCDFLLVREIVGMLLAQELYAICVDRRGGARFSALYAGLVGLVGEALELAPIERYVRPGERVSFAHLEAAARARGEVAIGVAEPGERPWLLPPRERRFEATAGVRLVVIEPLAAASASDEPARTARPLRRDRP